VAARVFPPLGDHWGDFALGADGLGDLHQNPFARSIFNHSGHYWRVLGLGCALMGRLRLVRQFAVCTTNVSPCRVLSGILRNLVRLCRQHRLHCTAVGTKENGSASTTENPGRVCGTASPPPRPGPDPPPYLWRSLRWSPALVLRWRAVVTGANWRGPCGGSWAGVRPAWRALGEGSKSGHFLGVVNDRDKVAARALRPVVVSEFRGFCPNFNLRLP
jgi:hypothetical protein